MGSLIAGLFGGYFFHPLNGNGYQFWSGIAGSFLTSLPGWGVALYLFTRSHNCHVKGCWRFGHSDPEHGYPACRQHHSRAEALGASQSKKAGETQ